MNKSSAFGGMWEKGGIKKGRFTDRPLEMRLLLQQHELLDGAPSASFETGEIDARGKTGGVEVDLVGAGITITVHHFQLIRPGSWPRRCMA